MTREQLKTAIVDAFAAHTDDRNLLPELQRLLHAFDHPEPERDMDGSRFHALDDDTDDLDDEQCPGCGCRPGDGLTVGCTHPDGCGFGRPADDDHSQSAETYRRAMPEPPLDPRD